MALNLSLLDGINLRLYSNYSKNCEVVEETALSNRYRDTTSENLLEALTKNTYKYVFSLIWTTE